MAYHKNRPILVVEPKYEFGDDDKVFASVVDAPEDFCIFALVCKDGALGSELC